MKPRSLKTCSLAASLAAVLLAAAAGPAGAADETQPIATEAPRNVGELVVTATRTPTSIDKIGSSISVITAEQLERQQIRFVSDVFETYPGLSVTQAGPRGAQSTVQIRGAGGEATLVLIDGAEVSDPAAPQTAFQFSHLLAAEVERVEILRGSQSVLYGGDAVGGVVNIVTKRGSGAAHGFVRTEAGTYDSLLVGGRVAGGLADDRFGYAIDVQYLSSGGFSAADEELAGNNESEAYDNLSINGRFDFDVSDAVSLLATFRSAEGSSDFDFCGGAFCDNANAGDEFSQLSGRLASTFKLADGFFVGEASASFAGNYRDGFDDGMATNYFDGERTKYDFQGTFNFDANNILLIGAETEEESFESDAVPAGGDVRTNGYFAQYQLGLFDSLYLSAGVRIDDHETFGTHDSYRATAAYVFEETGTKIKGSYSTGFRAPSLFELFGQCCGEAFGNEDLEPETSSSWDAGIEQSFLDGGLIVDVTYFELTTDDDIVFCCFGNGAAPNFFNVPGETTSEGVELSADWAITPALNLLIAYTYNEVEDSAGTRLIRRPKHIVNANLDWSLLDGRAGINLNVSHSADQLDTDFSVFPEQTVALDEPVLVNIAADYALSERVRLNARVENLLDEEYQPVFGFGAPGLSVFGGVRVDF